MFEADPQTETKQKLRITICYLTTISSLDFFEIFTAHGFDSHALRQIYEIISVS
jgi:hypothetical protein